MALAPTQLTAPCVATPAWNPHDGEVADRHVCWLQQKGLEAAGQGSGRGGTRGMSRSRGRQSRGTEIGRMHEDMVTAAAARRHGPHHGMSGLARAVGTGRQQHWADSSGRTGQRARRRGSAGCAVRIAANSRLAPEHPLRQLHEPGMIRTNGDDTRQARGQPTWRRASRPEHGNTPGTGHPGGPACRGWISARTQPLRLRPRDPAVSGGRPPLVRAAAAQLPRRPSPGQPAEGPPTALHLPGTRLAWLEEANCTVPRV